MWRETNVFGIYLPPLIVYAIVALLLWAPLRALLIRLRLERWLGNPALAHLTAYVFVLALLVTWL